jgi:hypothetical protein
LSLNLLLILFLLLLLLLFLELFNSFVELLVYYSLQTDGPYVLVFPDGVRVNYLGQVDFDHFSFFEGLVLSR